MLRFDDASRRATHLSLNSKVLDAARELGIKLSQTVEELLVVEEQRRFWERWNKENKEAIAVYNKRIEREGLPLARYRTFLRSR